MYPSFENDVVLLAVGFGSAQTVQVLEGHWMGNGYPGLYAGAPDHMVRDYEVTVQSTKFGIASDGEIVFRHGYGSSGADIWRERLRSLAEG